MRRSSSLDRRRRAKPMTLSHKRERLQTCILSRRELAEHDIRSRASIQYDIQPPVTRDHRARSAEIAERDFMSGESVDAACCEGRGAYCVDEGVEDHERGRAV